MSKFALLLAVFGCLSVRVLAQTEAIADTVTTNEVVVTATKSPTPLRQTAKPVQIIPRSVIEQNAGKDLSQLLQEQSGLIVNGAYSNPSKDKSIFLRGAANDLTLILVNGQPVFDPSGPGGALDLRLFPLAQIERIEILKGSQSTLYGSDAIAGVINLITREGAESKFQLYGNAAYGSLNTQRAALGARGQSGALDYNLTISRNASDGISEARAENPTDDFDDDGFEQLGLQGSLGIQAGEHLHIAPFFRYTDFDGDYDAGSFQDAANTFESQLINTGARLRWQSPGLRANLNYSYTNTDRVFNSTFGVSAFEGRFHQVDGYATVPLSDGLELLAGANFQSLQLIDSSGTEINPEESIISPYATLLYRPVERVQLEVGYRYNEHSSFGGNSNVSLAGAYWLDNSVKVFGNYTTGFKAPSVSQLFGPFGANPRLEPQTSRSIEGGLQYGTATASVFGRVTYFNRRIENVIIFDFVNGFQNRDEQRDQGVEVELRWRPTDRLQLGGQYTYLTGELQTVNGIQQDTAFNNLVRRPAHSGSLQLAYQFTDAFQASANAQYIGERTDLLFDPITFVPSDVPLESYLLLNIYAEYQLLSKKVTLFVDAKNVLDQDFSEVIGFNGLGFNILGGVRVVL